MNRFAMRYLVHALEREGFHAGAMSYRSASETMDQHVARLARRVAATAGEVVHLAGHSFGGLIALRYLQGTPDARIGRTVLLGAPVSGCLMAERLGARRGGRWLLRAGAAGWRRPGFNRAPDPPLGGGPVARARPFGPRR